MKEKIIKTAIKHFANKGYENTSIEEIAKELNITKPAIYYHFKSKKNLYNEIFKEIFTKIELKDFNDIEKNISHYIDVLGNLFLDEDIAKIFSKELAFEGAHLEEETIQIISKTIKYLIKTLQNTNINPFFIQTLVISSFTNYINTIHLREKVSKIVKQNTSFKIKEEIRHLILTYIKAHK